MPDDKVTPVNVVVVFYSRYGETEQLALAAGVGAVQAHGNIRLRRLKDLADAATIAGDSRWTENLQRMHRDYIAPRQIDADWADAMLVVPSRDLHRETEEYVTELLADSATKERLLIVTVEDSPADRLESARAQGRRAVEMARQRKM